MSCSQRENYLPLFAVKRMASTIPPMTIRLINRTVSRLFSLRRRTSRGERGNNHLPKIFVRRFIHQLDQLDPDRLKIFHHPKPDICLAGTAGPANLHLDDMIQKDYSTLTFQQLHERLESLILRFKYSQAREMPLDAVYAETGRVIAAMDKTMEQHKGTLAYDQYQQERKIIRALPILPSGSDFSRQ